MEDLSLRVGQEGHSGQARLPDGAPSQAAVGTLPRADSGTAPWNSGSFFNELGLQIRSITVSGPGMGSSHSSGLSPPNRCKGWPQALGWAVRVGAWRLMGYEPRTRTSDKVSGPQLRSSWLRW